MKTTLPSGRAITALCGALLALVSCGCSSMVEKTVSMTGKVAIGTVTTVGKVSLKTTTTAITTSGKLAGTVVTTSGSVVKSAATAAGSAGKTAFVTFQDTATGVAKEVPWVEGMKLYAASKTAEFDMYLKAFEIVSKNTIFRSDWGEIFRGKPQPTLQAGDIVRVSNMVAATPRAAPTKRTPQPGRRV